MYIHTYVDVYIYVYMYSCMYVLMYVYMYEHINARRMYVCMHDYDCKYLHVYINAHIFSTFTADTVRVQSSNIRTTYTILKTRQDIFFVYLCLIKHSSYRKVVQGVVCLFDRNVKIEFNIE
jgi:hypothetical protein